MGRFDFDRRARWAAVLFVGLLLAGAMTAAVRHDDAGVSVKQASTAEPPTTFPPAANEVTADASAALSVAGGGSTGSGSVARSAPGPTSPDGPRIVRRADLRVELGRDGFRSAFDKAAGVATVNGGYVANSTSRTEDGRLAAGSLLLRVPAAAFDKVRAELAALGEVDSETVSGEDVGGQLVDIEARLRSLAVEEETLRTLMAKAKTVGETIEVQQQLTRVRQEIEQLSGQRARLSDAAALATVNVELFEPGVTTTESGDPNPIAEGARDAVKAAAQVIGGTLVVLGYTVPLAVLLLLAWALWRVATRRRTATALSST